MIPRNSPCSHIRSHLAIFEIDSAPPRLYIAPRADDVKAMFEHELKRLEGRVDALVQVCDKLQDENRSLKQRQDSLTT
jgi:hypothetical protein